MWRSAFRTMAYDFLLPAKPDPPLNTIHKPQEVSSSAVVGPIAAFNQSPRSTLLSVSCSALPPNTRHFSCLCCLYWALRWRTVGRTILLLALLAACLSYAVPAPAYARSSTTEVVLMLISGTFVATIDRLVCSYYLELYYSIRVSLFAKICSCSLEAFLCTSFVNHLMFLA